MTAVMILAVAVGTNERECLVAPNPFENPDAKYLVLINDEGQDGSSMTAQDMAECVGDGSRSSLPRRRQARP